MLSTTAHPPTPIPFLQPDTRPDPDSLQNTQDKLSNQANSTGPSPSSSIRDSQQHNTNTRTINSNTSYEITAITDKGRARKQPGSSWVLKGSEHLGCAPQDATGSPRENGKGTGPWLYVLKLCLLWSSAPSDNKSTQKKKKKKKLNSQFSKLLSVVYSRQFLCFKLVYL